MICGHSYVKIEHIAVMSVNLPCEIIILIPGVKVPSTMAVCVPLFPVTVKQYCRDDDSCRGRPILTTSDVLWLV